MGIAKGGGSGKWGVTGYNGYRISGLQDEQFCTQIGGNGFTRM